MDNEFLKCYATRLIDGETQLEIFSKLWSMLLKLVVSGVTNINAAAKTAYNEWKNDNENAEKYTTFIRALSANKTGYVQHLNDAERIARRATSDRIDKEKLFWQIVNAGLARTDIALLNKYSADNEISVEYVEEYIEERKNKSRRGGGKKTFNPEEGELPTFDI
jgi:hypothetical protein